MHAGCSTPTTRPGNGPGIPGSEVAALLPSTVEAARLAYLRKSRRRVFTTVFYSRWMATVLTVYELTHRGRPDMLPCVALSGGCVSYPTGGKTGLEVRADV